MTDKKQKLLFLTFTTCMAAIGLVFTAYGAENPAKAQTKDSASTVPSSQTWGTKWAKVLVEAKKEGKVFIYTDKSPDINKPIKDAFEKKFGLELEFFTARPPELAARLFRERQAGLFIPDLMNLGVGSLALVFKPAGVIDPIEPILFLPEVMDEKNWINGRLPFIDDERKIIAMVAGFRTYLIRNKNMVKESEIKSYRDLLDPKWKRQIVMDDPMIMGSGTQFIGGILGYYMKYDEGLQFLKDLARQEPIITRDARLLIESVARGKYALGLGSRREMISQFIREGAPIAWVYPEEGGEVSPAGGCLSLVNKAPHPNATILFTNWLLTKEGQTAYAKGFGSPSARTDVPTIEIGIDPDTIVKPGVKLVVLKEEFWKKLDNAQQVFKGVFGALLN